MTADELHALAVRTRDAARLAERHGTSTHGYRRAAREACERMGEMAEQIASVSAMCVAQRRLRAEARAELRDLVAALGQDDGPRAKAIRHARAVLEEWGMR